VKSRLRELLYPIMFRMGPTWQVPPEAAQTSKGLRTRMFRLGLAVWRDDPVLLGKLTAKGIVERDSMVRNRVIAMAIEPPTWSPGWLARWFRGGH